ncbi:MAG: DEAD/DEAH box helicase family protein, partial [Alphaproteobacteria bacterium]
MTLSLRPYQRSAIDALYDYFAASAGNPLVVLPTGTGKSLC